MNDPESRLEQVIDAYGASPKRWPEDEREELLSLVERSPQARARLDAAAELDSWLDAATPTDSPSPELVDRILAGADPEPKRQRAAWRWAAVVPLAAAAALALWIQNAPEPMPQRQPQEIAMADLGVYDTPTDVLLEIDGFDPLTSVPSYECDESDLGCLELNADPQWFQQQSIQGGARRTFT